jgi:dihydroneopterin aldolase
MDTIFIQDLRLHTRVGIYPWERELPQLLKLDLELGLASDAVFRSDDFVDALDYAAVVTRLKRYAGEHRHQLLERFAQGIADIVLTEFAADWARVRVAKLAALAGVKEIGVAIERRRDRPQGPG